MKTVAALLALFVTSLISASGPAQAGEIVIIANPSIPVSSLTLDQISNIYLLKTGTWADGMRIVPVNREFSSETRNHFNSVVLKADSSELSAYWNQMHFKGKTPPVVQESDQAMVAFVQNVPGAIGYVSAAASTGTVKVLGRVP